jgi:hypothetical protein
MIEAPLKLIMREKRIKLKESQSIFLGAGVG